VVRADQAGAVVQQVRAHSQGCEEGGGGDGVGMQAGQACIAQAQASHLCHLALLVLLAQAS